jgi:hypothetical protein
VARYGPNASWQEPEGPNSVALPDVLFPAVTRIQLPAGAELGVAIDGSAKWWPGEQTPAVLPVFSPYQGQPAQFIDIFDRGQTPFDYQVQPAAAWVRATPSRGRVDQQVRVTIRVDWFRAPKGTSQVPITVSGPGGSAVVVQAPIDNPDVPRSRLTGFVEANGYVSMLADHFTRTVNSGEVSWQRIPDIGRSGAGMTPSPVTAASQTPGGAGPRLEYAMSLFTTGQVRAWAYLSPRNNILPAGGLKYAISIDDATPQIVNVTTATGANDTAMNRQWERNTSDNVNLTSTTHVITAPGVHVLKFWMVDPTVVVQKLVVDTGGMKPSYFGPPESIRTWNPERIS